MLPVIDTKLADVKLPGTSARLLFEEFDHIDCQINEDQEAAEEELDMSPQPVIDNSDKIFSQSRYLHNKVKTRPLACLKLYELMSVNNGQTEHNETLFFFGAT